jgi:uridine kinase
MERKELIHTLATHILLLDLGHPVRVGVSGVTASGKTTFCKELTAEIRQLGRACVQTSIDDFHNPRVIRYSQGRHSARGYYEDAHDYRAIREKLLEPLGPSGYLMYQLTSLDLATDVPLHPELQRAPKDMVLVVDGTFLYKDVINDCWDFRIFIDTDFDLALKRGSIREADAFGSVEAAEKMFVDRYHAASRMYLDEENPRAKSQAVVVVNNDISHPELILATP